MPRPCSRRTATAAAAPGSAPPFGKQSALKIHQHRTDGPAVHHNAPDVSFGRAMAGSGQKVIFKR